MPGLGRFHGAGQLKPVPQLLKPACSRAWVPLGRVTPLTTTRENPRTAVKTQCSKKNGAIELLLCAQVFVNVCFRLLGSRRHIWSDITLMKMLCRWHYYMKIRYYHVSLSLWADLAHRFQSQYYEIMFKFSGMHTQFAHWCCPAFSHGLVLCFLSILYSLGKKERNRLNIFAVKKISFLLMLNPQMDDGEL